MLPKQYPIASALAHPAARGTPADRRVHCVEIRQFASIVLGETPDCHPHPRSPTNSNPWPASGCMITPYSPFSSVFSLSAATLRSVPSLLVRWKAPRGLAHSEISLKAISHSHDRAAASTLPDGRRKPRAHIQASTSKRLYRLELSSAARAKKVRNVVGPPGPPTRFRPMIYDGTSFSLYDDAQPCANLHWRRGPSDA